MRATIRRLERRLVVERARLGLDTFVAGLVRRWERADDDAPDATSFDSAVFGAPAASGVYVPTWSRAARYLNECRAAATHPEPGRLLRILVS